MSEVERRNRKRNQQEIEAENAWSAAANDDAQLQCRLQQRIRDRAPYTARAIAAFREETQRHFARAHAILDAADAGGAQESAGR